MNPPLTEPASIRALSIPELLGIIFEFSEHNFANSLVCKTWADEASSILWYNVTFTTLLALLGPRIYVMDAGEHFESFVERPTSKDFDRFLKFSSKVRVLRNASRGGNFQSYAKEIIPTWAQLASDVSDATIFPNLHTLDYGMYMPTPYLPLFLQPQLQRLRLDYADSAHKLLELPFDELPLRAPCLKSIEVVSGNTPSETRVTLANHLLKPLSKESLPMLRKVLLPVATYALICSIAALPALEDLVVLGFTGGASLEANENGNLRSGFTALKHLNIYLYNPSPLSFFIQSTLRRLMDLNVDCELSTHNAYEKLFSTLSRNLWRLQKLHVKFINKVRPPSMAFDTLRLVTSLTQLRSLVLVEVPIHLKAEDVVSIVRALPLLTIFELNNCSTLYHHPARRYPAIAVLAQMIPHCQGLRQLGLTLDATQVPNGSVFMEKFQSLEQLTVIKCSTSKQYDKIPGYLDAILPIECRVVSKCGDNIWISITERLSHLRSKQVYVEE